MLRSQVGVDTVRLDVLPDEMRPRLTWAAQITESLRLYDSPYHSELGWWTAPFLDVIHRLQQTQTPDLAVRWNCKAGKCGSCSAEVNGHPKLMCMTRMSTFAEDEVVTITPMRTFPVIRDLVTDVSFNYEKAREIPSFTPPTELQPRQYRMAQVDVRHSQEFRKCIECFLCQNVCHVIRDHGDNKKVYAGPRFFIRIAELDMHPLDTADRRDLTQDHEGLGLCNITKCCTEVSRTSRSPTTPSSRSLPLPAAGTAPRSGWATSCSPIASRSAADNEELGCPEPA